MSPGEFRRRDILVMTALLTLALTGACRPPQDMADQPQKDPYESSSFFADQMSARPLVAGTVARGTLQEDEFMATGKLAGAPVDGYPFPIDAATLERGHERFNIYCAPCHDRLGTGNGMIVQRGYRRPPSLHDPRLIAERSGYFFDVMTNGFGSMPAYGPMIPVRDRWAITAYIKALQISQNATVADVPKSQLPQLSTREAAE